MVDDYTKDGIKPILFHCSSSIHQKLKELAARESRSMKDIILELIESYIKIHGEGNPNYELTKWEDPEFKITPAFGESLESKWDPFLQKCTRIEFQEIIDKAEAISKRAKKQLYGLS